MTANIQFSIHPRSWRDLCPGREKANTCEPRKLRSTVEQKLSRTAEHCKRHPNDGMGAANLARFNGLIKIGNLR